MTVPGAGTRLESTVSGTAKRSASAALRSCSTCEPSEASQEHFLAVHGVQPPCLRNKPGIGGEYALHVGIDAALVRAQRAAAATAVVSEPPRPSVVMSFPGLTP